MPTRAQVERAIAKRPPADGFIIAAPVEGGLQTLATREPARGGAFTLVVLEADRVPGASGIHLVRA